MTHKAYPYPKELKPWSMSSKVNSPAWTFEGELGPAYSPFGDNATKEETDQMVEEYTAATTARAAEVGEELGEVGEYIAKNKAEMPWRSDAYQPGQRDGYRKQTPWSALWPKDSFDDDYDTETYGDPSDPFTDSVYDEYEEARDLLLSKHNDYGPENISRAPGGPLLGLAVRLHDKVARLAHLIKSGAEPENESLRDTMMDIQNYGAIGVLVLDGEWPGVK